MALGLLNERKRRAPWSILFWSKIRRVPRFSVKKLSRTLLCSRVYLLMLTCNGLMIHMVTPHAPYILRFHIMFSGCPSGGVLKECGGYHKYGLRDIMGCSRQGGVQILRRANLRLMMEEDAQHRPPPMAAGPARAVQTDIYNLLYAAVQTELCRIALCRTFSKSSTLPKVSLSTATVSLCAR